jgi:hypothetical protein
VSPLSSTKSGDSVLSPGVPSVSLDSPLKPESCSDTSPS